MGGGQSLEVHTRRCCGGLGASEAARQSRKQKSRVVGESEWDSWGDDAVTGPAGATETASPTASDAEDYYIRTHHGSGAPGYDNPGGPPASGSLVDEPGAEPGAQPGSAPGQPDANDEEKANDDAPMFAGDRAKSTDFLDQFNVSSTPGNPDDQDDEDDNPKGSTKLRRAKTPSHKKSKSRRGKYKHRIPKGAVPDYSLRYLKDRQRGKLGPAACDFLGVKYTPGKALGELLRVGVHREGTCFFHSVLDSLNVREPGVKVPKGMLGLSTDEAGAYRNLSSKQRKKSGAAWRKFLAKQVSAKWFAENLNTNGKDQGLGVFDAARGRMISFAQYINDYANPDMYVGDSVWLHIASCLKVNIFIVVVSAAGPRVYEAGPYSADKPSIALYLHDKGGSRGHYESIQTSDGQGVFNHQHRITQRLLAKAAEQKQ